jgi:hypothetical protein
MKRPEKVARSLSKSGDDADGLYRSCFAELSQIKRNVYFSEARCALRWCGD